MTAGMAMMGTGLFMLALIPLDDSIFLVEAAMLVIGCGLGLNTGPVNAAAVANVPAARSGTASGLVNTARMIGATLGVAVLGAVFAMFAGGVGEGSHIVAALAPALRRRRHRRNDRRRGGVCVHPPRLAASGRAIRATGSPISAAERSARPSDRPLRTNRKGDAR
jgi:MFS family permease